MALFFNLFLNFIAKNTYKKGLRNNSSCKEIQKF